MARCGEEVLCTVPDLICILERDTATPINTELLRYGFRVVVVGSPAPAQLTSAHALQVVGPQAFGYAVPSAGALGHREGAGHMSERLHRS